jgi:hypothetical protein
VSCYSSLILELRPWFVTAEVSTRGQALVVMLAYKIVRYLRRCWQSFDIEVLEALEALQQITRHSAHRGYN